jgi:hypothetical protein
MTGPVKTPHARQLADAIQRLLANDWPGAHALVQDLDDPIAWRVHGLVHRVEGDLANAGYWYDKAGVTMDASRSVEDEISELREYLEHGE